MAPRPEPPRDNAVRRHRRAAELTQAELAERVGVSRQTIVAVESGGYAPSVYLALALAGELGTSVERLFAPATEAPHPTHAGGDAHVR